MFQIYADNICIFDDTVSSKEKSLINPVLKLSAGAAGSLTFTMPKANDGYDTIHRLITTIRVNKDGEPYWLGRALTESRDLWGNRKIMCEGSLAFLNDALAISRSGQFYSSGSLIDYLRTLFAVYNSRVPNSRGVGLDYENVEISDPSNHDTWLSSGKTILEELRSITDQLGGLIKTSIAYSSYTGDYYTTVHILSGYGQTTAAQTLEFGNNLLDFVRAWDNTDFCTAVYPRGAVKRVQAWGIDFDIPLIIDENTTIPAGYVRDGVIIKRDPDNQQTPPWANQLYIEKLADFSDIESKDLLASEAVKLLETYQYYDMNLEVTAVDLHILNPSIAGFELLDKVQVKSTYHGLSAQYVITAITIPLDEPEKTKYTLGPTAIAYKRNAKTLTGQTTQIASALPAVTGQESGT